MTPALICEHLFTKAHRLDSQKGEPEVEHIAVHSVILRTNIDEVVLNHLIRNRDLVRIIKLRSSPDKRIYRSSESIQRVSAFERGSLIGFTWRCLKRPMYERNLERMLGGSAIFALGASRGRSGRMTTKGLSF